MRTLKEEIAYVRELAQDDQFVGAQELADLAEAALEEFTNFDYVEEGWWHPNVKSGKVHDHTPNQPATMHRECEPVYTKRPAK